MIGFVTIATSTYLIAITKREEVARIFDKPVYLITDVALLPLTSENEAADAIKTALGTSVTTSNDSDSSVSDTENEDADQPKTAQLASTPADDTVPYQGKNSSGTRVAEDVATRNVSFGKFASQWLSRQKWPAPTLLTDQPTTESNEPNPASKNDNLLQDLAEAKEGSRKDMYDGTQSPGISHGPQSGTVVNMLPRILKTTKMIFTSGSYFFSYDIDLTRRFEELCPPNQPLNLKNLDHLVSFMKMAEDERDTDQP